jgi:hypothetical protein
MVELPRNRLLLERSDVSCGLSSCNHTGIDLNHDLLARVG